MGHLEIQSEPHGEKRKWADPRVGTTYKCHTVDEVQDSSRAPPLLTADVSHAIPGALPLPVTAPTEHSTSSQTPPGGAVTPDVCIEWRRALVEPYVPALIQRIVDKHGDIFENIRCHSPGFIALTTENLASIVQLFDKFTPCDMTVCMTLSEVNLIDVTVRDLEVVGLWMDWLKPKLQLLKSLASLGSEKARVDQLKKCYETAEALYVE